MARSEKLKEYWREVKIYAKENNISVSEARKHMLKVREYQIGIYKDGKLLGVKTVRYRERKSHKRILKKWEKWAQEKSEGTPHDYKVKFKKLPARWCWSETPVR